MFYNVPLIIILVLCCTADHCVAEPWSVWGCKPSAGRLCDTPWLSHRHWCLLSPPDWQQVRSSSEVNTLIKFCTFVFNFGIACNRHSCGVVDLYFSVYCRVFNVKLWSLWMLHFNCRHLLAAGLDSGRITLYTWKHIADKSSGWVLLAELDQRFETIKQYKFLFLRVNITCISETSYYT